ncbi:hypothetical protein [Streptomyces sp. TS71-3]|uniref:hypothetical protein n=1 Tax=Streptomyces sp. TS71-3 TaxID=2733862 RepID=UPI001AFDAB1F|nr:hypothetical protein [Streptomyces sp. TS71-3]GHJ36606.1 hypothetical protein Sm713_22150 [Streptomyces sp. TS71-3]
MSAPGREGDPDAEGGPGPDPGTPAPDEPRPWWREPFRMFQTNLREVDAGLDVAKVLDFLVGYGADTWLLSVGGIVSNYPTGLPFQTRNPHLADRPSGDLVGDAVAEAGRRGIRVLGRMDFSKVDHARAEAHPEWCFVDAAGERQVVQGLVSVCPSGEYYQERLFDVLGEVLERYPAVAGFFLNWMSFNEVDYSKRYRGVCHCPGCARRWAAHSGGAPLPTGPESPGYGDWQRFTRTVLDDLTARIRAHVARRSPDAALILGDRADIVFHEANNAVGRPLWHHRTAEHVSAAKAQRPGVPVLVNSVGFLDMPYRWAGEDPHHFAQYLVQAVSRGAVPSTYVMGTPDTGAYGCLGSAGRIIRFHRDHAGVYRDLRPEPRVLLVRPDPARASPGRGARATGEFQGVYLALQERHIPFDVVPQEALGRLADAAPRGSGHRGTAALSEYRLIVLPDLGPPDPDEAAALDAYAAAGGALLATGATGLGAGPGTGLGAGPGTGPGGEGLLAALPYARHTATWEGVEPTRSLHLVGIGTGTGTAEPHLPVIGAFHVVVPRPDAGTALPALSRAPYGPPEKCHGHLPLEHPGLVTARHGAGQVTALPWHPGLGYRELGLAVLRDLIADQALATGGCDLAIGTGLPPQVEIVLGRSAAGRVVHLLNRSGDAPQRFMAPLPVGPCTLTLPWPDAGAAVHAHYADRPLTVERAPDGTARVELPRLDLFEVLTVPYATDS